MDLIIVESPTKARKLSEYLGRGFEVEASVGHVRDLPKKKLGIDLDNNFEPTYEVDPGKKAVISKLRVLAGKADHVYLATDPDREGEAIAWHIKELLTTSSKDKSNGRFLRATFHEITKPAVMAAISNPGEISQDLVEAQQARRVVDRLVGYQVSPVLWKKVRRGLSAGRVQSVALRLIVEREREIEAFVPEEYWEVDVLLNLQSGGKVKASVALANITQPAKAEWLDTAPNNSLVARLVEINGKKYEPSAIDKVEGWLPKLTDAAYTVKSIERKTRERISLPPFTTSTLQQAAATRLGFTSKQTMTLAQQLYEEGLITYHRTDSVQLSTDSISMARSFIEQQYGPKYVPSTPRRFTSKSKNAQEAHEAIRVTEVSVSADAIRSRSGKMTDRHERLYDLIWRRFLASQMASAIYDQTAIVVDAQKDDTVFTLRSSGSVLTFDGWMKLFQAGDDKLLPAVSENQPLYYSDINAAQKFTQPPPRYNDASLVKELEKRGIGRPSTYASIISVIVDRGYVERSEKRFIATQIGMTVSDFLVEHFPMFMEYDFTAEMEEDLDRIARGEKAWQLVVKTFYKPLADKILVVTQEAQRVQIPVELTGETCPTCGETEGGEVVIRSGKFGKFKSCNRFPECNFTENLVEKVEGVVCPLCQTGEVVVKNSRWGKSFFGCSRYPDCNWASWQKPEPGATITQAEWDEMQKQREERKKNRAAKTNSGGKSSTTKATKTTKSRKTSSKSKKAGTKPKKQA